LKDFVHTEIGPKVTRTEARVDMLVWIVGIALTMYMGIFIAGGIQLYLLNGRVGAMEQSISTISKGVGELQLKKASENAADPQNIEEVSVS